MLRVVLIQIAMFATPFVLYGAYVFFARNQRQPGSIWEDAPLPLLAGLGLGLMAISLVLFATFSGYGPDADCEPARVVDGKIVPGECM